MLNKSKWIKTIGVILCFSLAFLSCAKEEKNKDSSIDSAVSEVNEENKNKKDGESKIGENENTEVDNTSIESQYKVNGILPSLAKEYADLFKIGVALSASDIANKEKAKLVTYQFNSITCENEMKADFTLDREATIKREEEDYPVVNLKKAEPILNFAKENGLSMRGHTLVWYSQTPRWLFTVGFNDSPDAPFVTREVMLSRMENYIKQELEYVNTNYPGVIYAWDVVNEAIEPGDGHKDGLRVNNNYWYEVIGEDYIEMAFTYARKYAASDQKLFYNDYETYNKTKMLSICKLIEKLQQNNLIDGMGMQDHIKLNYPNILDYQNAINKYTELGIEIQVTELDIDAPDNSDKVQEQLAVRYKKIMEMLLKCMDKNKANITSVTFWGLTDDRSWLNDDGTPSFPLLFDKRLNPKKSFFGVLRDSSVKD